MIGMWRQAGILRDRHSEPCEIPAAPLSLMLNLVPSSLLDRVDDDRTEYQRSGFASHHVDYPSLMATPAMRPSVDFGLCRSKQRVPYAHNGATTSLAVALADTVSGIEAGHTLGKSFFDS